MHRTVLESVTYSWQPGVKLFVGIFEHLSMIFACTSLNLSKRLFLNFFAVSNLSDMTLEPAGE